jgi:hypothetical protein
MYKDEASGKCILINLDGLVKNGNDFSLLKVYDFKLTNRSGYKSKQSYDIYRNKKFVGWLYKRDFEKYFKVIKT